ncbi:MAG TPA: Ig-like domain-containing protein [Sedimentisphaerales bacterium]|nr:Ig-like domain-containing protein [Sedimentisphaerales bacterium]
MKNHKRNAIVSRKILRHSGMIQVVLFSLLILRAFVQDVYGADPAELQTYLRKSTVWHSAKLEKVIPLSVYFADKESASPQQAPVIVYVKGLAVERVGRESDLAILSDYIEKRYIVISVDYGSDARAVSPAIDENLHAILGTIYGTERNEKSPLLGSLGLEPTPARCFFLPAGYRVATDLVFWDVDKHGSHGTMKRVVRAYNEQVVDEKGRHHVAGRSLASSPGDLIDRDGAPLDCKLRMDIIYPSQADKKVPLIFWISTTTIRAPSSFPSGYRPHMTGFPMRGYAYAIIDHCYNPVALHYGHFKNGYSLDNINGLKAYTAAIRFIRAHADAYNVDPRYIGGWGHSKGAYAITRLSEPKHAERGAEYQRIEGEPEGSPEPQPWPGYSSRITAGYQSMGNGTRRSAQYVTEDYAATIVACGELDHFNHWLDWPRVVDAYERANANHVALGMLGLGHELPYDRDEELGVDRYELVMSFFDRYLKVEEKLAPAVLSTTPRDKAEDVAPSEPITIQFAPVMDEASIVDGRGVKIIRSRDGSPVKGFWTSSRQGARFTFAPKEDFRAGEKYKVIVTTHVKNEAGTPLDEARITEFTVGKMAVETKTSAAKKPAIVALESIGAVVEVDGTGSEQFAVKVDLRSGKVTDAELEHVKRLTRLRELRLDGIPITDDGLKHLQKMTSLQRLDLPNTRITDNGLSYLRELKNLSALSIKGNRVTDAGLKHLQGLTNLEMLSLGPNQISDIGVISLRDLTKLRYLNLTDTQVTDSVFEYLKPLTNLRTLRLRGTRVTEKGVQDMKQRLPDCNVSR